MTLRYGKRKWKLVIFKKINIFKKCRVCVYNKTEEMTSYKYSGFRIMATNENYGPRNHFVIDRATHGDISLPPPPKHFKYVKKSVTVFIFTRLS